MNPPSSETRAVRGRPCPALAVDLAGRRTLLAGLVAVSVMLPGRGLALDPAKDLNNPVAPPVHIERVIADGHEVIRNADTVVPPGFGELEFHFNALSFSAPGKVQIRYRLEGFDKDWVDAGDRRLAFYTNLKPGRYKFRVIAANADGVWNRDGDSIVIELQPNFYQTGWFYGAGVGLLFTGLIGGYRRHARRLELRERGLQESRDRLETEVNRRTAELAYERDLLRELLENSPDHIYFKDAQSRFIKTSRVQARRFGAASAAELVGKSDFDFFSEDHARLAFEDEQKIIRTGQPMIGKVEKEVWPDGRASWVLTNKMPLRNGDGQIVGTMGISKDITALKHAEMELAYERDLLRALLDHSPDSIFFKDLESRLIRVSHSEIQNLHRFVLSRHRAAHPQPGDESLPPQLASVENFHKYAIGKTDADFYGKESAEEFRRNEQEIISSGQPVIGKIEQTTRADGSQIWHMTTKAPWRDLNGNIIGIVGTSRNVTDLKTAEAKVEQAHKRLMEISRQAGMAEVATNVLHNVGNVLNSVNVSAALVTDKLKKSQTPYLGKVAALLNEHAADLPAFIATEKGRQLPGFISQLAQSLAAEQEKSVQELELLRKHIEHIKDIVAMQQNYAKISGVSEIVDVTELVEDALRMNAGALTRHDVGLVRAYGAVPPVTVEKHKVLQILVNLIRNAKYACDDSGRSDKQLTLEVAPTTDGVRISVVDNGIGISAENLTRIFSHGFTTRKGGHGFGLHSGALAAGDLGGSLTAHSDGVGQGSTFTLNLPLQPPES